MLRALLLVIPHKFFYKRFMGWFFCDYINKDRENEDLIIQRLFQISKLFKFKRMPEPRILTDEELKNLSVRVLYVVGENEKVYSARKALDRIHIVAPRVNTELIPGAGHDLLAVEPDLIMDKILKFLKT